MNIFLLGVPGCGKSELFRRLTKKLEGKGLFSKFPRVDDFPKLWAIFMEDQKSQKWERCRPTEDGGYKVTDDTVWDDILKEVNKDVLCYDEDINTHVKDINWDKVIDKSITMKCEAIFLALKWDLSLIKEIKPKKERKKKCTT